MATIHPADALAQDVLDYVEKASDDLARGILGSPLSPQTATMTASEKTRYFANQFWTPDGQPNQQGRDALQTKYGPQGFAQIAQALSAHHARLSTGVADAAPDLPEEA